MKSVRGTSSLVLLIFSLLLIAGCTDDDSPSATIEKSRSIEEYYPMVEGITRVYSNYRDGNLVDYDTEFISGQEFFHWKNSWQVEYQNFSVDSVLNYEGIRHCTIEDDSLFAFYNERWEVDVKISGWSSLEVGDTIRFNTNVNSGFEQSHLMTLESTDATCVVGDTSYDNCLMLTSYSTADNTDNYCEGEFYYAPGIGPVLNSQNSHIVRDGEIYTSRLTEKILVYFSE
jgi:hypothetical protein